ncbi:replication initiator protein A domain protein [Lacticaseibacillus rhamnosus LMS2-1]|uniref:Replication initiator protein A domain protein n=3 Tax=Lacticaseibacillus TaxID=2759736 RepID=C2JSZ0_LACRM|nr:replication initiator protein A [Lacticaseibacillus rhamnosus]EEN81852.1 replication initiator protein A domain protein [Lacticaseibacillus rhamnosus LMS2-1]
MIPTNSSFKFYQATKVYGTLFFQLPKVLLYSPTYKNLSAEAKLAYVILKDRLEYSLHNDWVDENGNVYFIFSNAELQKILNCSEPKVIKTKKELEQANLLFQKKMGFDPKLKRNIPNRLYLGDLNVSATDVYKRQNDASQSNALPVTSGTKDSLARDNVFQSLATSGTKDSLAREKVSETLDTNGTKDSLVYLYKDLKTQTRDNRETKTLDFSTDQYSPELIQKQNQDLVQNAKTYLPESTTGGLFLNREGIELLGLWCNSPKQMHRFLGIILNAKKAVEREHQGTTIVLDDPQCQEMINKTMRRFFNVLRSDSKKINNVENYLFGAMKETLVAYWNKSLANTNGGDFNEF